MLDLSSILTSVSWPLASLDVPHRQGGVRLWFPPLSSPVLLTCCSWPVITSGLFKISAERGSPVLPRALFKRCIISFVQTSLDPCLLPVPVDLVWMSVSVSEPLSWIRFCGVLCDEECGRFPARDLLLDSLEPVSTCHCMYVYISPGVCCK